MRATYISGSLNKFGDLWYASLFEYQLRGIGSSAEHAFRDLKTQMAEKYHYDSTTEFEFVAYPDKTLFFLTIKPHD